MIDPNKPTLLSDEEVEALGVEYRALLVRAETQTQEQRAFLEREIGGDTNLGPARKNRLIQILNQNGFKFALARVTKENVLNVPNVQVVYDIDDELYAYLRQDSVVLPPRLRGFLDGGIELGAAKNMAEDLMPKTGKTKPR